MISEEGIGNVEEREAGVRRIISPIRDIYQRNGYLNWGIDKAIIRDIERSSGNPGYNPTIKAGEMALEYLKDEVDTARDKLGEFTERKDLGLADHIRNMQLCGSPFSASDGHSLKMVGSDSEGNLVVHNPGRLKRALAVFPLFNAAAYVFGDALYQQNFTGGVDFRTILQPRHFHHWHQDLMDSSAVFHDAAVNWGIGNFPMIFIGANLLGLGVLAGLRYLRKREIMAYRHGAREVMTENYVKCLVK